MVRCNIKRTRIRSLAKSMYIAPRLAYFARVQICSDQQNISESSDVINVIVYWVHAKPHAVSLDPVVLDSVGHAHHLHRGVRFALFHGRFAVFVLRGEFTGSRTALLATVKSAVKSDPATSYSLEDFEGLQHLVLIWHFTDGAIRINIYAGDVLRCHRNSSE